MPTRNPTNAAAAAPIRIAIKNRNPPGKVSLNARDNFIKGIGLKEKDVATDIKQNGVIYYCDKKRKEEYFQLTNPIEDRENKYASFADLVNAVHNEFLVQSGAKQKEKHKDVIESEYRIIE